MSILKTLGAFVKSEINGTVYTGYHSGFQLYIEDPETNKCIKKLGIVPLELIPSMITMLELNEQFDTTNLRAYYVYSHEGVNEYHDCSYEAMKQTYC